MEEQLLSLAEPKVEQAEVYSAEIDETRVQFKSNEFHAQDAKLTRGLGLRVFKDGRVGFAASSNPARLTEQVSAAVETAQWGRKADIRLPAAVRFPEVKLCENRALVLPADKLRQWGQDLIDAVRARVPDLKLDLTFGRTYRQVRLLNTSGLDIQYSVCTFSLGVTGLLVLDGLYWLSDFQNLSDGSAPNITAIADKLEQQAKLARTRARLATGTYPVVFMPESLGNLLLPLSFATLGTMLEKNSSPLIGKVGQQLLDPKLTIVDNPLRDHALDSSPVDGEGTARRRNPLFENGVFRGFIFDLVTAAACRQFSTGSAERGYSSLPTPGTTNFEVLPGSAKFEPAIADIKEGVVIYSCVGGGQSNIIAGDVTLGISCGFKVEQGQLVGRVKDVMLGGNVYELLRKVTAVGDTQRDLGALFAPFIRLDGIKLAAK
jgi:PmbA protein